MRKIFAIAAAAILAANSGSAATISLGYEFDTVGGDALFGALGEPTPDRAFGTITYDDEQLPVGVSGGGSVINYVAAMTFNLGSISLAFNLNDNSGSSGADIFQVINDLSGNSDQVIFNAVPLVNLQPDVQFRRVLLRTFGPADSLNGLSDIESYLLGNTFDSTFSASFYYADGFFGDIRGSNLRFSRTSASPAPVPLPASLPLMLVGLTGLGLMVRRRRSL